MRTAFPSWLAGAPHEIALSPTRDRSFAIVSGYAVAFANADARPGAFADPTASSGLSADAALAQDADDDGIPDALDILIGGKKVVLAAAPYVETYRRLAYPNGDMPRNEGVCTDVVVRALRNAGFDLQQLLHEDVLAYPRSYPGITRPDTSVDHRRVRNLVPYFERHWRRLTADPRDASAPYHPGDVVFLDTMRGPEPDHVGLVSDTVGSSGLPLIINSWTNGYVTSEMDLLAFIRVTHRYRVPSKRPASDTARGQAAPIAPTAQAVPGLQATLEHLGLDLPGRHRQVLLVSAPTPSSSTGRLQRYWRDANAPSAWQEEGRAVLVRLGEAGLGVGRGAYAARSTAWIGYPQKTEGDRRSPAGVFLLHDAFGTQVVRTGQARRGWPLRLVRPTDVWIDDSQSSLYNTWQSLSPAESTGHAGRWRSAELLSAYALAVIIGHNESPIQANGGSAIFLHSWDLGRATNGCTGVAQEDLEPIVDWLAPDASPLLVQIARH